MANNGKPSTELKLYEITDKLLEIGARMVDADGEMTPEMEKELAGWEATFEEKAAMVALFIRHLELQAGMADEEATRLHALAKPRNNTAQRLKVYLMMQMEAAGVRKIDTTRIKAWIQSNPPSVRCDVAPEDLPSDLVRMKMEVDKTKILEKHKAGQPLPEGVEILQGQSLRIK